MADQMHLGIALFVFIMLLVGLVLTIVEYYRGLRRSGDLETERDRLNRFQVGAAGGREDGEAGRANE
ncbi:hypothetical protein H0Z60_09530 [Ectothiorhodospiraceae bacterium WFHF3C12]|nr:hypothetical protein [Ectothiorhodospiraceae bacterium WFHF3C12]